jgi:hypothetical protein
MNSNTRNNTYFDDRSEYIDSDERDAHHVGTLPINFGDKMILAQVVSSRHPEMRDIDDYLFGRMLGSELWGILRDHMVLEIYLHYDGTDVTVVANMVDDNGNGMCLCALLLLREFDMFLNWFCTPKEKKVDWKSQGF